ncbi:MULTISPECIES: hypothetical protein [unclassified Streptomyces]|uniref:hypothetical protein n=1 Tax=unclassified Streptomyces TaxID=2593676 RepID=UPI000BF24636|nr:MULTISPECIES: hypothetical protein [unclassified Streptomyces]
MTTQTETTKTPQEIGVHALAKAVKYADQAARYSDTTFTGLEVNGPAIAAFTGLATVYADIAKAAALVADRA